MLDANKVGSAIAALRKTRGYSQETLAGLLTVSPQAISKWENGHTLPETSLLPVLAQIFGCTIDDILMPAYLPGVTPPPTVAERQADYIADRVVSRLEKQRGYPGLSDDEIADAVLRVHPAEPLTVERTGESRAEGRIARGITVTSPQRVLRLVEQVYHKRPDEFNGYAFLNGHIRELPRIYHIDHDKKLLLLEALDDGYFRGYAFNEDSENGRWMRANHAVLLRAAASFHRAFWENGEAFGRIGLPWHFECPEHTAVWILDAMEKPFRKYRRNEEAGKLPKTWEACGHTFVNEVTPTKLGYFEDALRYLRDEYPRYIRERFQPRRHITVIHGDLHPGQLLLSKEAGAAVFSGFRNLRIGLGTEDLAMLAALHIAPGRAAAQPLLDVYYDSLRERAADYSREEFMRDYRLSVAENLFFTLRLINRGIFDFGMRDRALTAFGTFVLGH